MCVSHCGHLGSLVVHTYFFCWNSCLGSTTNLNELLTKEAVKGTLTKTEGDYYLINDEDGKEIRVHVDMSTKMDKVMRGDRVKAYITDKGHVTTLQRLEK